MGITPQASDGSGSGAPASKGPRQFSAYSSPAQALVQASATRDPSGAKMAPSAAIDPPFGTWQIKNAERGVQPDPLASLYVTAAWGQRQPPPSGRTDPSGPLARPSSWVSDPLAPPDPPVVSAPASTAVSPELMHEASQTSHPRGNNWILMVPSTFAVFIA
jgi:hypothetical protein